MVFDFNNPKIKEFCRRLIRHDNRFFENGKWNFVEIEYGCNHQNNIFKNYEELSKVANIMVIDIN